MKGQPLAYNKDNQEDKEPLFDTVDTLLGSLRAFADMMPNVTTNKEAITKSPLTTNKMARHPQSKFREVRALGICL